MEIILSLITGIGAIAAAVFAYRTNSTSVASSVMEAQEKRINLLETQREELEIKMHEMEKNLIELQGQNKLLQNILQGRDPKMEEFMKIVTEVMLPTKRHREYVESSLEKLLHLQSILDSSIMKKL